MNQPSIFLIGEFLCENTCKKQVLGVIFNWSGVLETLNTFKIPDQPPRGQHPQQAISKIQNIKKQQKKALVKNNKQVYYYNWSKILELMTLLKYRTTHSVRAAAKT